MDMTEMDDAMSGAADMTDAKRRREKLMRAMMQQYMMGGMGQGGGMTGMSALANVGGGLLGSFLGKQFDNATSLPTMSDMMGG
jgi:hypothetical protein